MKIFCQSEKLKQLCCDHKQAVKKLGKRTADCLSKRIKYIEAVANLADFMNLPRNMNGRPHLLTGDRAGSYGLELDHPRRMTFVINDNSLNDGSVDLKNVRTVLITEIVDYH